MEGGVGVQSDAFDLQVVPPPHMDSQIDNTCSKDNTLGWHKDTQSSGKSNRTLVHCPTGREVLILLSEKRGN